MICDLETGFEIITSAEPFSSIFGIKLEAENIDRNSPPPKRGATTNNFIPLAISPAISKLSILFVWTIPLRSSIETSAKSNANIKITNVEIAKNVMIIFLDKASRIVKFDIVIIFSILVFTLYY